MAADVRRVLDIVNAKQAIDGLSDQQSQLVKKSNLAQTYISFPNRGAACVSASGPNRLILRSDKPESRPFQGWITDVVIPAIRKDGAYITGEEKRSCPARWVWKTH